MAHYSGNLSVASLFDSFEADMPTPTQMKQAAMSDDCASARLFMRTVDAFIDHVLGIDPSTKQARKEGGLFGRTKAYFGMVETQGRGTLHIHFLIWIHSAPANSEDYESQLQCRGVDFISEITWTVSSRRASLFNCRWSPAPSAVALALPLRCPSLPVPENETSKDGQRSD
jgi:hypothetical protein